MSVIVPVFNAIRFLQASVGSILNQTYESLQVILVDDGSTDGSGALCDALADADPRVVVVHQTNGGIAAAQNTGLALATGEFITFCDHDDLMAPHLVSRLVSIAVDARADMSMCRWHNVGATAAAGLLAEQSGEPHGRVQIFDRAAWCYQNVFSLIHRRVSRSELRYFSEANWGKLYRAELFDGVRFPAGHYAQDVAVAMTLYRRVITVASCSDRLYLWVQHGESVSHSRKSTTYYSDIVRAHAASFASAVSAGIRPARASYGFGALRDEKRSIVTPDDAALYEADRLRVKELRSLLPWRERAAITMIGLLRRAEVVVYDRTVHRRR